MLKIIVRNKNLLLILYKVVMNLLLHSHLNSSGFGKVLSCFEDISLVAGFDPRNHQKNVADILLLPLMAAIALVYRECMV
jgi:hypothetical protein